MSFTLRLPFRVAAGREFGAGRFVVEGLEVEISHRDPFHVITVSGLESEDTARALLRRFVVALWWVGVETGDGIEVTAEPQTVELRDTPAPPESIVAGAYGIGDEGRPAIFPDDKPVRFAYVPPIGVRVDTPLERFRDRFATGLDVVSPDALDSGVRLAAEVFLSSYSEPSPRAQFLARTTALEIMVEREPTPDPVREAVARWKGEVAEMAQRGLIDEGTAASLSGRVDDLRLESIRRSLRSLVADALGAEAAAGADAFYGVRSTLVHEGQPPAREVAALLTELTDLTRALLRWRLTQAS